MKVRAISYLQTGEFDNASIDKSLPTKNIYNNDDKFLPFVQERDSLGRLITQRREHLIQYKPSNLHYKKQSLSLFLDSTIHTSVNDSKVEIIDLNSNKSKLLLSNLEIVSSSKTNIKQYISNNKYLSQRDEENEGYKSYQNQLDKDILDRFFSYDIRLIQEKRVEFLQGQAKKSILNPSRNKQMFDSIDVETQKQESKFKCESPGSGSKFSPLKIHNMHSISKTEKIKKRPRHQLQSLEPQTKKEDGRDESEKMFSKLLNQVDKEVKMEQKNANKFIHPYEKISVFPIPEKFAIENKNLFANYLDKATIRTKNLKVLSEKMKDVVDYRRYNGIRDPEEKIC